MLIIKIFDIKWGQHSHWMLVWVSSMLKRNIHCIVQTLSYTSGYQPKGEGDCGFIGSPSLWGHFKDGVLEACDEVCWKKRGRRSKGDTWWWNKEVKEAV